MPIPFCRARFLQSGGGGGGGVFKLQPFLQSATNFGVALTDTFLQICFQTQQLYFSSCLRNKLESQGNYAMKKLGTLKVKRNFTVLLSCIAHGIVQKTMEK